MRKDIKNIFSIFVARVSPLLIGLVFIPFYKKYSDANDFDIISLIFTIQSLSLLLDLGISQNMMRLSAISNNKNIFSIFRRIKNISNLIIRNYLILGILFFFYLHFFTKRLDVWQSIGIVFSLFFLAKNNIILSALIGSQNYKINALIQITSNLLRQAILLFFFIFIDNSISWHIWINLLYLALYNYFFYLVFYGKGKSDAADLGNDEESDSVKSYGLSIAAICGALAMQVDKLLVGAMGQPGWVGDYYLAQTIACIPLLFVAIPIAQYFQPKLFFALSTGNEKEIKAIIGKFSIALFSLTTIPSVIALIFLEKLLNIWIGPGHDDIKKYASILLIGTIPGCFGYVFHTIIMSMKYFRFLAFASFVLTTFVLLMTFIYSRNNLVVVSASYALYHTVSVFVLIFWVYIKKPDLWKNVPKISYILLGMAVVIPLVIEFLNNYE